MMNLNAKQFRTPVSAAVLALMLAACGGGGDSGNTPAPVPAPTPAPTPSPSSSPAPGIGTVSPSVDVSAIAKADPGSQLADGWQYGGFIEIYVRGYSDSNGDGYGDLKGLTAKLDYLKDLGIKGIWLMPVTQSQDRDHGYTVTNYRDIEKDYGSIADLDSFVQQAHARGIGVILDYVMNHSAAQNPLFINSASSPSNPYRNWYVWQNTAPSGWNTFNGNPWHSTPNGAYYGIFWDQMPDFNLLNPDTVNYHKDNLRFWLNQGVDGFRFDAVPYLVENSSTQWQDQPQTFTLMHDVQTLVTGYANRYMVCEGATTPRTWAQSSACGSAFAFDHQFDITNAANGNASAIQNVANYFKTAPATMATIVSNHDSFAGDRLWNRVGGDIAKYKLAAATYLLQPGMPFIYYGEEIGMAEGKNLSGDWALRTPMSWTSDATNAGFTTGKPFRPLATNVGTQNVAAELNDPNSILSFYKAMLKLRNSYPSIARGTYVAPFASGKVMGFQRLYGSDHTLVLINYDTVAANVGVTGLAANAALNAAYPAGGASLAADASGNATVSIPAQSVLVYTVQP